jgi:YfiH family protein
VARLLSGESDRAFPVARGSGPLRASGTIAIADIMRDHDLALRDSTAAALPSPGDGFAWRTSPAGLALVCRALESYAAHLFTTREWRLGSVAGDREAGWQEVAEAMEVDRPNLARLHQVHGAAVVVRRRGDGGPAPAALPDADILISNDPATAVAIQTADCVPLLIADRATGAVAAAHAGWRGLAAGVPGIAVRAMRDAFGPTPANLIAAIGPSICAENYEVDALVRSGFEASGATERQLARWFLPGRRDRHWQFDGWQSAIDQLQDAGVPRAGIHAARLCTAAHPQLCSYRRDGTGAGRIAAAIRAR